VSGLGVARPPFAVLHVCTGNICRSPMAERLLAARLADAVRAAGVDPADLLLSHSGGTGGWHAGEPMNPPAARQVLERGGDPSGFGARQLHGEHIDASDLVLTATGEQASYVTALRPDASHRTFALLEFSRLLPEVDTAALPAAELTPQGALARGIALVDAVDKLRAGTAPRPEDDLDDPWGLGDRFFTRVADDIETPMRRLARILTGS
jgi:low molecular weight protein-tyrosine phosphatase